MNHENDDKSIGILLCINGTGILYSWLKKYVGQNTMTYDEINEAAKDVPTGCQGLSILPFGNGAERVLQNEDPGAQILGVNFNIHTSAHMFRAANEGIAFSFKYGLDILSDMGIKPKVMRVGNASMFQSFLFREIMANTLNITIESYNTDGALGAALAAGYGAGFYRSTDEAISNLEVVHRTEPMSEELEKYEKAYELWKDRLQLFVKGIQVDL